MEKIAVLLTAGAAACVAYGALWLMASKSGRNEELQELQLGEVKLVVVVNCALRMGTGKIAAQVSHGALGAYRDLAASGHERILQAWQREGEKTVVVGAENADEILRLRARAAEAGLPCHVIRDAGRTEVAPNSLTVMAIGPAPRTAIDPLTGALKLLR